MEKLDANQIEQFLKIERDVTGSADHIEVANKSKLWSGEDDTVSSMTITSTMIGGGIQ